MIVKPSTPQTSDAAPAKAAAETKATTSQKSSEFSKALRGSDSSDLKKLSEKNKDVDRSITEIEQKLSSKDKDKKEETLDSAEIAALVAKDQARGGGSGALSSAQVQSTSPPNTDHIVQEVANRILVSSPEDAAGHQEVRIQLKASILPGTEVRVFRDAGSLQVQFVTSVQDSQLFVTQRQTEIQSALSHRLAGETVRVSVEGSRQTHGGQGEGRSRQQYIRLDEEDDSAKRS